MNMVLLYGDRLVTWNRRYVCEYVNIGHSQQSNTIGTNNRQNGVPTIDFGELHTMHACLLNLQMISISILVPILLRLFCCSVFVSKTND